MKGKPLTRGTLKPGAILINHDEGDKQYRVERLDGDEVHFVSVRGSTKRILELDNILSGHWELVERKVA